MSYIIDLRKVVGHRPLLQVGASVIVVDECGRILLQLRTDNNSWGYAGGSVEIDEKVEDAAKNAWYYEYVAAAVNAGIVHGYSDKIFGAGVNIKREDMAAMISSIIGDTVAGREINFVDAGEVSEYAKAGVSKASALGVITGFEDGTFKPKAYCTRAQAAVVIYNLIKVGGYNG